MTRSSFVMIFYALSNAAYRVSINSPGAELEGVFKPPPDRRVRRRATARRGLKESVHISYISLINFNLEVELKIIGINIIIIYKRKY